MSLSRPQRRRTPSYKIRYASADIQDSDWATDEDNELAVASPGIRSSHVLSTAISRLYNQVHSMYTAKFGKPFEPEDDGPEDTLRIGRNSADEQDKTDQTHNLSSFFFRNSSTTGPTAYGYRRPVVATRLHEPLQLPDPGPRQLTSREKLDAKWFDISFTKSKNCSDAAERVFWEWMRWEILGRMRDANTVNSNSSEKIWVKEQLQQRWRIWVQVIPTMNGRKWKCGKPGCDARWEPGLIVISFEPPHWTQQEDTMKRRLRIMEELATAITNHTVVDGSDSNHSISKIVGVSPEEIEELDRGLLDTKTSALPRWKTDNWDNLWEPDYKLLRIQYLISEYGQGKRYCIACFESLLPPVHVSSRTASDAGTVLQQSSIPATPLSSTYPSKPSIPKPSNPSRRPRRPTLSRPFRARSGRRRHATFIVPPTTTTVPSPPPTAHPIPGTPRITLLVNGEKVVPSASPSPSPSPSPPPQPHFAPEISNWPPLSLSEVAGDPTRSRWSGVYSSVFPDTRGRFAVRAEMGERVWRWKEACCKFEMEEGEEQEKVWAKRGLEEVVYMGEVC